MLDAKLSNPLVNSADSLTAHSEIAHELFSVIRGLTSKNKF